MATEQRRLVPCREANDWIDGRWRGKADGRFPVCNSVGHVLRDGVWWHRANTDDFLSSSQQDPTPAPDLTGASGRVLTVGGYVIAEAQVPDGYLWFVGGSFLLGPSSMTWATRGFTTSSKNIVRNVLTRNVNDISTHWKQSGCPTEYTRWVALP